MNKDVELLPTSVFVENISFNKIKKRPKRMREEEEEKKNRESKDECHSNRNGNDHKE